MKVSIIYVVYTLVYIIFVGVMSREIIGIDQALEYILKSGSDSELSE